MRTDTRAQTQRQAQVVHAQVLKSSLHIGQLSRRDAEHTAKRGRAERGHFQIENIKMQQGSQRGKNQSLSGHAPSIPYQMVEFFGFGVQIALIFGIHAHHQRHTLGNADAAVAQGLQFFGVVGQ